MITHASIEIDAPAALVWDVYGDVERWAEWSDSITEIAAIGESDLSIGHRYRIKQPRMPSLVWKVTALEPGRSWTWVQSSPGGRTTAVHEVVPLDEGRTLVRQSLEQAGPLGGLFGRLMKGLTGRYLEMESRGLKERCEQQHRSADAA